jgi:hypothetical protein
MSHTNYHALINLGRKAGLNTADLYRAMTTRPADRQMSEPGQTDCNGFRTDFSERGTVEYRPSSNPNG